MRVATLIILLVSVTPRLAAADAIGISTGFCPPGLDHRPQQHADACTPRACTSDAECGEGAACHEIAECWTQQASNSINGRVLLPEPIMVDVVLGLCRPDHSCTVGTCSTRRQCEPTSSSAAWDPAQQRWTGTFLDSEPGHGCSASPARATTPGALFTLSLVLIGLTRRRRR